MILKKILKSLMPLLIFLVILAFLVKSLHRDPHTVPSPFVGKPMPSLPGVHSDLFKHHVTVLNVFASWCLYCRAEHPLLMDISETKGLTMIGIDYKDEPKEMRIFLKHYGNPYSNIIADPNGTIAINLGVYGTPETFIIDKKGVIRYKHVGPITLNDWRDTLKPLIQRLLRGV